MIIRFALLCTVTVLLASGFVLQDTWAVDTVSDESVTDAYVYILGRALVNRQEQSDLREPGAAYNTAKFVTVEPAEIISPNLDVMLLEAWIAVDDVTPVFLDTPEIKGRYYTVQISDEWGEVIANLNERSSPARPYGKFAFVGPGSKAAIPKDALKIELRSSKAKMIVQIELRGDQETAVRLLRRFVLTPLGQPAVKPPVSLPFFTGSELPGVEIFESAEALLSSAQDLSPVAAELQQKVRAVAKQAALNPQEREKIDKLVRGKAVPQFLRYTSAKAGKYKDNWLSVLTRGDYGKDYWMRTGANFMDIWANTPHEVVHFIATRDADGRLLEGNNDYLIHFPKGQRPDDVAGSFWSVTLLGAPDNRVVPNRLGRFLFDSFSGLKYKKDGSLGILISREPKTGIPESNWLPSPEDKPFSLIFRIYAPKSEVKRGEWFPPAVKQYPEVK